MTCSCPLLQYFRTLFWDDITIFWDENLLLFLTERKKPVIIPKYRTKGHKQVYAYYISGEGDQKMIFCAYF
jgi:hypothetical protein